MERARPLIQNSLLIIIQNNKDWNRYALIYFFVGISTY